MRAIFFSRYLVIWLGVLPALLTISISSVSAGPYDVEKVVVRVNAVDAVIAKSTAMTEARSRALGIVLKRITMKRYHKRLPHPSDTVLQGLLHGMVLVHERISFTYYAARFQIYFNKKAVQSLLNKLGFPFYDVQAAPSLIIPVYKNVDEILVGLDNQVAHAWDTLDLGNSLTPLLLPKNSITISQSDMNAVMEGDAATMGDLRQQYQVSHVMPSFCKHFKNGDDATLECRLKGCDNVELREDVAVGDDIALAMRRVLLSLLTRLEDQWKLSRGKCAAYRSK